MTLLGILGGTFDPVHIGHLRAALELKARLALPEVRLIPCGTPAHREQPQASNAQRLELLRLAVADEPGLIVDDRELRRPGPSYMVDTLRELKVDQAGKTLCLALGSDAFMALHTWHQWQDILALAHLVVWHRPQWELARVWHSLRPEVRKLVEAGRARQVGDLTATNSGRVYFLPIPGMDISASQIRSLVTAGDSIRYLVPDAVLQQVLQIYGKECTE